jgi:hypothetical protein
MTRMLDANMLFSGGEPKIVGDLTRLDLMKALNWYSQNKDAKDSLRWANEYVNKKLKLKIPEVNIKNQTSSFGWICRIVNNGGILPEENTNWLENEIEKLKLVEQPVIIGSLISPTSVMPSIQERIKDSASRIIGELDGFVDEFVTNGCKETSKTPKGMMVELKAKSVHTKVIVEHYKKVREEIAEVLVGNDEQLVEGYSNFKKVELKRFEAFLSKLINDALMLEDESKKNRKPRARKVKSPDELVGKLKYCVVDELTKFKSVDPKAIIGCSALWVYNSKTRKLGCYFADDAGGLSIKGSTVLNYTESKSVQKKLRKPEQVVPEVISGGKVFLKNVIDSIRAVQSPLSGRINADTVLVRIIK